MALNLVENLKVVQVLAPQVGAAAAVTSDYVSVKNLHKGWFIILYDQNDADDQTWALYRATAVAPTGSVVVAETQRIWSDLATATSDLLVERTAAINYASGTGQVAKMVIIEVDPAKLGEGYDVVAVGSAGAIAATSYVAILFVGVPRYETRVLTSPTVITD